MMNEFKIEKGIPIPEFNTKSKYPFKDMQIGDSFFAPGKTVEQMQNAATTYRKKLGYKFVCRSAKGPYLNGEEEIPGTRVWRRE
jgi:hypothetical protein